MALPCPALPSLSRIQAARQDLIGLDDLAAGVCGAQATNPDVAVRTSPGALEDGMLDVEH